jgi:hypothetical protein
VSSSVEMIRRVAVGLGPMIDERRACLSRRSVAKTEAATAATQ